MRVVVEGTQRPNDRTERLGQTDRRHDRDVIAVRPGLSDESLGGQQIQPVPYGDSVIELDLVPKGPGRVGVAPHVLGEAPVEFTFERRFVPKREWASAADFRRDFFAASPESATLTMEPA